MLITLHWSVGHVNQCVHCSDWFHLLGVTVSWQFPHLQRWPTYQEMYTSTWRTCMCETNKYGNWWTQWVANLLDKLVFRIDQWLCTACLKAQIWFLGVGGAKKINFFLEIFFLGHTYSMTTEFTWTNCESHLNWKELDKSFIFFI